MKEKELNQFSRLELLIGCENVELLKNKNVLIVGLGGVGGFVTESIARSGIGNISIVDYDTVDITNINRQIIALHSTIGKKKTELFEKRILDINPNCNVTVYDTFLDENNFSYIIDSKYDFIIDCCDSVPTKKMLLLETYKRKIPFISSMGTANKMNPSLLKIVDIKDTINDPLARIMRKYVKDNNIKKKVMVLSSSELPKKNGVNLGSNSFVPASAGLLISSYVINNLIK